MEVELDMVGFDNVLIVMTTIIIYFELHLVPPFLSSPFSDTVKSTCETTLERRKKILLLQFNKGT
jgi:hypothetical protein